MVNYQNGKIYKMLMPDGYFYIGCTCNKLRVRKQQHKCQSLGNKNKMKLYKHVRTNDFDWNDIKIVIYELYACETKSDLIIRESIIIRLHAKDEYCLNTKVFTKEDGSLHESCLIRDRKYKSEHLEHKTEIARLYRENNKEAIRIRRVIRNARIKNEKNLNISTVQ